MTMRLQSTRTDGADHEASRWPEVGDRVRRRGGRIHGTVTRVAHRLESGAPEVVDVLWDKPPVRKWPPDWTQPISTTRLAPIEPPRPKPTPVVAGPPCLKWIDDELARWEREERWERRRNPDYQSRQVAFFRDAGRENFLRFATDFRIVKPVRLAAPLASLLKGRRQPDTSRELRWSGYTSSLKDTYLKDDLPWVDHPSFWRDVEGALVFVSFTYGPPEDVIPECAAFARTHGLRVDVRPDLNFYADVDVLPVIWRKRADRAPLGDMSETTYPRNWVQTSPIELTGTQEGTS